MVAEEEVGLEYLGVNHWQPHPLPIRVTLASYSRWSSTSDDTRVARKSQNEDGHSFT